MRVTLENVTKTPETDAVETFYNVDHARNYVAKILRSRQVPTYILQLAGDIAGEGASIFYASRKRSGLTYKRNGETKIVRSLTMKQSARFAMKRSLKHNLRKYRLIKEYINEKGDIVNFKVPDTMSVAQYKSLRKSTLIQAYDLDRDNLRSQLGWQYVTLVDGILAGESKQDIAKEIKVCPQEISRMLQRIVELFNK